MTRLYYHPLQLSPTILPQRDKLLTMSDTEIEQKRDECTKFVHEVLRPELEYALSREKDVQTEISEYDELGNKLKEMSSTLDPLVDLGHEKIYCRAVVDDTEYVFVHVGMGFHVELSLPEAIVFTERRVTFLREHVLRRRGTEIEKLKLHIQASEIILDGLSADLR
jgi:prefoldin subunit 5